MHLAQNGLNWTQEGISI